ncbi:DUF1178 family protein [Pontibaca methylaminivorans]|uniref:DUF1178 family protein n=1 Tax=Pontibaca methylaminivorans TaxID=515897 RepID=A0A1R3WNH9_9RHOB|nr:DUF1178 family protein [Pontibaca methylaminivorans]SIT78804.1 hypothetical protein SAMN05421849_1020 [Pontibaca methylaminivorans]
MIRYALKCSDGHAFESWFQSAEAYERLARSGRISCAVCGGGSVEKAIMAPRVSTAPAAREIERPLSEPANEREKALAELRRRVEENADYVGLSFAAEARAIHEGSAPSRAIYGEARPDDARQLIEDGVEIAPLPFRIHRDAN